MNFVAVPRSYGFAVYTNCPECGADIRVGGYGEQIDPQIILKKLEEDWDKDRNYWIRQCELDNNTNHSCYCKGNENNAS